MSLGFPAGLMVRFPSDLQPKKVIEVWCANIPHPKIVETAGKCFFFCPQYLYSSTPSGCSEDSSEIVVFSFTSKEYTSECLPSLRFGWFVQRSSSCLFTVVVEVNHQSRVVFVLRGGVVEPWVTEDDATLFVVHPLVFRVVHSAPTTDGACIFIGRNVNLMFHP